MAQLQTAEIIVTTVTLFCFPSRIMQIGMIITFHREQNLPSHSSMVCINALQWKWSSDDCFIAPASRDSRDSRPRMPRRSRSRNSTTVNRDHPPRSPRRLSSLNMDVIDDVVQPDYPFDSDELVRDDANVVSMHVRSTI